MTCTNRTQEEAKAALVPGWNLQCKCGTYGGRWVAILYVTPRVNRTHDTRQVFLCPGCEADLYDAINTYENQVDSILAGQPTEQDPTR